MNSYIVEDRTTGTKYAISVADAQLLFTETASAASAEPIVEDNTNAGTYWKIFIDDGELGYETTATVQDDSMSFVDSVTGSSYELVILDGQMAIVAQVTGAITKITTFKIVRYDNTSIIVMKDIKRHRILYENKQRISI